MLFRIDDLTADHGHYTARIQNLRLGNFHDVIRENGKVGELARFDRAFVLFFKRGVGSVDGKHFQRFVAGEGLLRVPAFAGFAPDAFAGNRGVELGHRFATLDRSIGSATNDGAGLQ